MIQVPVAPPPRRRSRVAEKDGRPGASPSKGSEAQDATDQRVSAALGQGRAPARARNRVAPPASAARASRRLAVRLKALASPQALNSTAPTAGLRRASSPTVSRVCTSRTRTSSKSRGDSPISCRPGPCGRPASWAIISCRPQTMGRSAAARSAMPSPKALTATASAGAAA